MWWCVEVNFYVIKIERNVRVVECVCSGMFTSVHVFSDARVCVVFRVCVCVYSCAHVFKCVCCWRCGVLRVRVYAFKSVCDNRDRHRRENKRRKRSERE